MRMRYLVAAGFVTMFITGSALRHGRAGQIIVGDDASLKGAVAAAEDGDEILIRPGTYDGGITRSGLTGVTIRSLDPDNPAVIDASSRNEGLRFYAANRVTVANLVVENAKDNGILFGYDEQGQSQHITLRNLIVRNVGSDGNQDGIKLSSVSYFHVDRVQIVDWGNGTGAAIDFNGSEHGLVENSYFEDEFPVDNKGMVIKNARDIVDRANRFVHGGSRPLQLGGWLPDPNEVAAVDVVAEGNVVIGSPDPVTYVNVDGNVRARRNVIYRPGGRVVRISKESPDLTTGLKPQDGEFTDNIIIWEQGDISQFVKSSDWSLPETFVFARNQWFNRTEPSNSVPELPSKEADGVYGVDPQIDIEGVVSWKFDWGLWLVNANFDAKSFRVDRPELFTLAVPGEGAELDFDQPNPLVGNWTLEPVGSPEIHVPPFSQAVLIQVPEPSSGVLLIVGGMVGAVILLVFVAVRMRRNPHVLTAPIARLPGADSLSQSTRE